ncbi:MAG: hypothetical protein ACMG6E_08155 [Candidatus Roizmanbacteria bacterium]
MAIVTIALEFMECVASELDLWNSGIVSNVWVKCAYLRLVNSNAFYLDALKGFYLQEYWGFFALEVAVIFQKVHYYLFEFISFIL